MSHYKLKLGKCRTVFFDLEFYVPEASRLEKGFSYNPWDKRCRLLGGSFFTANPSKHFDLSEERLKKQITSLWLWDHDSEKALLQAIYELLNSALQIVSQAHDDKLTAILCGIGISTSDILVLTDLFKRYKILDNGEAFAFMNKFRILDLSQMAVGLFNANIDFIYPKVKNDLLNKFVTGQKFESGTSVWEMYEKKEYQVIQDRVVDEIVATHQCYREIVLGIRHSKAAVKRVKGLEQHRDRLLSRVVELESLTS